MTSVTPCLLFLMVSKSGVEECPSTEVGVSTLHAWFFLFSSQSVALDLEDGNRVLSNFHNEHTFTVG